jgi:hypothetical protein
MATTIPDYAAILTRHGLTKEDLCLKLDIGVTTWYSWLRGARKPSPELCLRAEQQGIGKHELRPDLWPPSPAPVARPARRKAMAA